MKLFPRVLVRLGGGPFDRLEGLCLEAGWKALERTREVERDLDARAVGLVDALHEIIGRCGDARLRGALVRLRRDVHNLREVPTSRIAPVVGALPLSIQDGLEEYRATWSRLASAREEGRGVYEEEVASLRRELQRLVQSEPLKKGLVLSSHSLLAAIPGYAALQEREASRDAKTEAGLLRYVTRLHAKTSPFSTFTLLATGEMGESALPVVLGTADPGEPASQVRLNTLLFRYLRHLLLSARLLHRWIPLRPNSTLRASGGQLVFLTSSNNVDAFQRIPHSPLLELFLGAVSAPGGVAYADVVRSIAEGGQVDAGPEQLESFLDQLVAYGLLEFNLGVSGTDPDWDLRLAERLAPAAAEIPALEGLIDALARVRELAGRYGRADADERRPLLDEAFTVFRAACFRLHEAAGLPAEEREETGPAGVAAPVPRPPAEGEDAGNADAPTPFLHRVFTRFLFAPTQMFFEDATLPLLARCDAGQFERLARAADDLGRKVAPFGHRLNEQASIGAYFDRKYGVDSTVDLLTFYEDYYRDVKLPEARQQREGEAGQPRAAAVPAREAGTTADMMEAMRRAAFKPIAENIARSTDPGTPVHIRGEEIPDPAGVSFPVGPRSAGMFVQPFIVDGPDGPELHGVVNASTPGFGKLFSRFLHLFDPELTEALRARNQATADGALLAENCDSSFFHANVHPPLLAREVWMPGSNNALPPECQIPVTELSIRRQAHGLAVFHAASGRPVHVIDLGFQTPSGRSVLFRLLDQFAPASPVHPLELLREAFARAAPETLPGGVRETPRVVFDGRLVLARRAWQVPRAALPLKQPAESDWAYLDRVDAWRRGLKIPEHVFVQVTERVRPGAGSARGTPVGRDDYKPQYICFRNPFLVRLFARLATKVPQSLVIEEMLPAPDQLLRLGEQRYVTELLVEWHTPPEP